MNSKAEELAASHIIVAPGGMERPVLPGWTAPGVIGAGGRYPALRGGTLSADKNAPVVLAGNGPPCSSCLPGTSGRAHRSRGSTHRLVVPPHHGGRAHARWRARHAVCRQGYENGTASYSKGKVRSSATSPISAPWAPIVWKRCRVRRGRQDPRNQRLPLFARHEGIIPRAHPQFLNAKHAWDGVQRCSIPSAKTAAPAWTAFPSPQTNLPSTAAMRVCSRRHRRSEIARRLCVISRRS